MEVTFKSNDAQLWRSVRFNFERKRVGPLSFYHLAVYYLSMACKKPLAVFADTVYHLMQYCTVYELLVTQCELLITQLMNFTMMPSETRKMGQPIGITPSYQSAKRNYPLTHTPCLAGQVTTPYPHQSDQLREREQRAVLDNP